MNIFSVKLVQMFAVRTKRAFEFRKSSKQDENDEIDECEEVTFEVDFATLVTVEYVEHSLNQWVLPQLRQRHELVQREGAGVVQVQLLEPLAKALNLLRIDWWEKTKSNFQVTRQLNLLLKHQKNSQKLSRRKRKSEKLIFHSKLFFFRIN